MSDLEYFVGSAQFAALEPSWAGIQSERRLRGLLILGALFNKVLYIHDTQIADNPYLLDSYRRRQESFNNLFDIITKLVENNVVRVGLRDFTYIAKTGQNVQCDSLSDVFSSWVYQDMERAWVVPPRAKDRVYLLKDFDEILGHSNVLRYPYTAVKKEFMRRTRNALDPSKNPTHHHEFEKLPASLRKKYASIVKRDWFSHSDIFELLRKSNMSLSSPFVQAHGLFDESAYAHWNRSRLLGCNASTWNAEEMVTGYEKSGSRMSFGSMTHASLQKYALRTLNGAGLSLIATLTPSEILVLREKAQTLFQTVEFIDDCNSLSDISELRDNYVESVADYWGDICSYLVKTRPSFTQRRTRIGIFARDKLPRIPRWLGKVVSLSINLGLDFSKLPVVNELNRKERRQLFDNLSLRFLFFADTSAVTRLKTMFPKRNWMSRYYEDAHGTENCVSGRCSSGPSYAAFRL
ncbi:MAG: hypothetical protein ABSG57_02990 [Candidatus Bathyarchaeia archaeon]